MLSFFVNNWIINPDYASCIWMQITTWIAERKMFGYRRSLEFKYEVSNKYATVNPEVVITITFFRTILYYWLPNGRIIFKTPYYYNINLITIPDILWSRRETIASAGMQMWRLMSPKWMRALLLVNEMCTDTMNFNTQFNESSTLWSKWWCCLNQITHGFVIVKKM